MRMLLLLGWLLLPIGFGIWHHGPGQDYQTLDDANNLLLRADDCAKNEAWVEAIELYEEALKRLPPSKVAESRRIRLEKAKAQMLAAGLPEALAELRILTDELQGENADRKLLAETRSALAQAQYYITWLMRLEGQPRDIWEPEIEASRQTYRLLAEEALANGDEKGAAKHREDVESAVRLARMDLGELQGLPLPSQ